MIDERLRLLGDALDAMYEVISFAEGGEPDWERMAQVFLPEARFTRITPEAVDFYDLPSFRSMASEMLDKGVYTAFHEAEVARKVDVCGAVAHVLSAYETKRHPEATSCLSRGVNSVQLLWGAGSWRVLSLFWDETTDGQRVDVAATFAKGESHGQR
jgi:hypothetical protein